MIQDDTLSEKLWGFKNKCKDTGIMIGLTHHPWILDYLSDNEKGRQAVKIWSLLQMNLILQHMTDMQSQRACQYWNTEWNRLTHPAAGHTRKPQGLPCVRCCSKTHRTEVQGSYRKLAPKDGVGLCMLTASFQGSSGVGREKASGVLH